MNKSFKVIWSKVRGCYVVASELAKNVSCKKVVLAVCLGVVLTGGPAFAADTTTGGGDGVAIGTGSNAPKAENVTVGKSATVSYSNGASNATGDIAIGNTAAINNYASQGGSVAIGSNAKIENMAGGGEASFAFGQTTYSGTSFSSSRIPADPTKVVGSVAIGDNTFARTGSTMIGSHNYKGELGDTSVDTSSTRTYALNVYSTTIGANSFSNGAFTTSTGVYNIISSGYTGGRLANPVKNLGATINGSLNSVEGMTGNYYSGIANTISGVANRTYNSNGSLIYGAGNEITNSVTSLYDIPTNSGNSAKAFAETLRTVIKNNNGAGATLAIGGGNSADYTQASQLIGVNNILKGASGSVSKYNMIDGYKNTADNVNNVSVVGSNNSVSSTNTAVVLGDNRTLTGASNSVVIGSSASGLTTSVANAVAIGSETNVTENGGVALGSSSVASTAAGETGYDPSTKSTSTQATSTWKATNAAVSVGNGTTVTRQITSVAAGTNDTDAVNVAQLKAAAIEVTGTGSITVTPTQDSTDGHTVYTISGTAGSGGTTYTAGDNITIDNDVISAKDTRNTVVAGDNTSIDETANSDGSSTYTVNVKTDGQIENGNTGIVTGGTVYNETRVTNNGSYIKSDNTAGQNLSVLDSQVKTNADNINNLDNRVNNMGSSISKLGNRLDKVGAGAAALAALHPMDFDENNKLTFAAGLGNYRSQNAAAIGAFYRPDDWVMFSVGGAVGNGENMVNLGVSFALDRKTGAKNLNKTQSSQKIAELENKIQQQDQMMASMQQQMAAMQETINRLTSK